MPTELPDPMRLLDRALQGDRDALGRLLEHHRDRLLRLVRLRLDPRLLGRVDVSDVVQDVAVEAVRRLGEYPGADRMPFAVWLRLLTRQQMVALCRHHLGVDARDARREVRIEGGSSPAITSAVLAAELFGRLTSPSGAAVRLERERGLHDALDGLEVLDREVLALRHFEQLTNLEVAAELGLSESAASKRYVRALERLRDSLGPAPESGPSI